MTPREHELSQQLFGGQQQSLFRGLSWDKFTADLGKELTHQVEAGAHELAAALFNGNAFVMYQRNKDGQPAQEQTQDSQTMQPDHGQHLERGGRSM